VKAAKRVLLAAAVVSLGGAGPLAGQDAEITVSAGEALFRLSDYMTGANLEDLNYQLTGGLYSQLIHGESFEEPFGAEGISQQWARVQRGSAQGKFERVADGTFNGAQSQLVAFVGGAGEVGIDNAGLNRWGINLVKGKPYEGLLRLKTAGPMAICVSLLSADGSKRYAEKTLKAAGGEKYERLEFSLTPDASDEKGRFAITLTGPGSMTVGYAFLQPGPWGRFKGLPVRKDLAEAIVGQGIKVIRLNGSMINPRRREEYKWK